MTVSRALNGERGVRPETLARIESAVAALGYTPNNAAKALAGYRHFPRIAFLFDGASTALLAEMVGTGLEEAQIANALLLFIKVGAGDDPVLTAKLVVDREVEGVILPPPLCDDARLRLILLKAGLRVVAIGCWDDDPTVSTIGIDDRSAAFEAAEYLIGLGHRRIGLILGNPRRQSSARRRLGFEAGLEAHGVVPDRALQWEGRHNFESAIAAAEQALNMRPRVTALFVSNVQMAEAAISVARGRGINVPRALTVFGFDDSEVVLTMVPQLTTVSQPIAKMVREGVRQLAAELYAVRRQRPPTIKKLRLDHAFAFRESDAPPEDRYSRSNGRAAQQVTPNTGFNGKETRIYAG